MTVANDARIVATVSHRQRIELWNGFTGERLQTLDARNDVTALRFTDDGNLLASGHQDGSVRLWNTQPARELAIPRRKIGRREAEQCWEGLTNDGSAAAFAMQTLLGDPDEAIALLERRLTPAAFDVTDEELSTFVAALDSNVQRERGAAEKRLTALGPAAAPTLRSALEGTISAEQQARIERILAAPVEPPAPPLRRRLLAIMLAADLKTVAAEKFLERIVGGAEGAPETEAARAALRQIALRERE